MEKIEIKVINKSDLPLPEYKTADAAGMDLRAHIKESIRLESLERTIVPTGLSIELPKGYEAQIRPRSGLTLKSGLSVINSPGTIDADYRGEIKIILANLSSEPQEIKPGERIAQMVIAKHEVAQWIPVEELSESGRGAGGFGHTGQK